MTEIFRQGTTVAAWRLYEGTRGRRTRRQEHEAAIELLCEVMGRDVAVVHDGNGAPRLIGQPGCITLSHCSAGVAVAYDAVNAVGIDMEVARGQLERVKAKFLSDAELGRMSGINALLDAWTVKEALYKAMLTPGIALADIDLADPRYIITTLHPAAGIALTLAVKRPSRSTTIGCE